VLADGAVIENLGYWIDAFPGASCEDGVLSHGEFDVDGGYFLLVVQASSRDRRRSVNREWWHRAIRERWVMKREVR
jgi:hypothetical protein